eukprot:scaffold31011_cov47-Cyclotella_meneghiniana.AAC.1
MDDSTTLSCGEDVARSSNESIGSGNGWNARIGCDTHSSGHGLFKRRCDEENHTQCGEAADDVGPQKPPRQQTKGAAPQANPNEQLCPPPWLLER